MSASQDDAGRDERSWSPICAHLRGRGDVAISTDAIMALTRGES